MGKRWERGRGWGGGAGGELPARYRQVVDGLRTDGVVTRRPGRGDSSRRLGSRRVRRGCHSVAGLAEVGFAERFRGRRGWSADAGLERLRRGPDDSGMGLPNGSGGWAVEEGCHPASHRPRQSRADQGQGVWVGGRRDGSTVAGPSFRRSSGIRKNALRVTEKVPSFFAANVAAPNTLPKLEQFCGINHEAAVFGEGRHIFWA